MNEGYVVYREESKNRKTYICAKAVNRIDIDNQPTIDIRAFIREQLINQIVDQIIRDEKFILITESYDKDFDRVLFNCEVTVVNRVNYDRLCKEVRKLGLVIRNDDCDEWYPEGTKMFLDSLL